MLIMDARDESESVPLTMTVVAHRQGSITSVGRVHGPPSEQRHIKLTSKSALCLCASTLLSQALCASETQRCDSDRPLDERGAAFQGGGRLAESRWIMMLKAAWASAARLTVRGRGPRGTPSTS
jgi:hypothetical protein